jgi:hypothetical protein
MPVGSSSAGKTLFRLRTFSAAYELVPLTGLEPVLSALRGRRVNHLHYSGKN